MSMVTDETTFLLQQFEGGRGDGRNVCDWPAHSDVGICNHCSMLASQRMTHFLTIS